MTGSNGRFAWKEKEVKNRDTILAELPIVTAVVQYEGTPFESALVDSFRLANSHQLLKLYSAFWEWWDTTLQRALQLQAKGRIDP